MKSNATMLYGHLETVEERSDHLVRLRELQDLTQGFVTFIPLAFHPENTVLDFLKTTPGQLDLRALRSNCPGVVFKKSKTVFSG